MTYRTAEGEVIDIRSESQRAFLAKNYPAVMAEAPTGMSDGYQFMPSFKIAENLIEKFGMGLVSVGQQYSRARDPRGQEHFMRFRLPSAINLAKVGDSVPELVIMNSHNGRSTLRAHAGVFRLICANGMVVSDQSFGKISLRHFGIENSFEAFGSVLDDLSNNFTRMDARMGELDEFMLTPGQQIRMARELMDARGVPDWVEPFMVLNGRRAIEMPNPDGMRSIWKTYNVLQESLAEARDIQFERAGARARSLRPLTGARAQVLVNERIWGAMEAFISKNFPEISSVVIEAKAVEKEPENTQELLDAPAKPVVDEAHAQETAGQEEPIVRPFEELMALDYEGMATISDAEVAGLGKDDKKKLSSRKSYLKKKANA